MSAYTVGEVARLAGVSVRTLHHYDRIGLLVPAGRSAAGYRHYDQQDLDRLWRIRVYCELDVPLDQIAGLIDGGPDADDLLRQQHELLVARRDRLQRIVQVLERKMEARKMGIDLTPDEMFEVFGDFEPGDYAQEVQERWGETDAYKQSQSRSATYSKQDWLQIQAEAEAINAGFIGALQEGEPADGERARGLAEQHREHISRWFYDCGHEMHANLGQMYVDDPRFTAHYEEQAEGLARYIRDAMAANAEAAPLTE